MFVFLMHTALYANWKIIISSFFIALFTTITETWLSESIHNNEILPVGYNIIRKDRKAGGGGVLLAITECGSNSVYRD